MCGLFGVINSNPAAPRNLEGYIKDAFIAGAVRGTDSAGVFNINKDKEIDWHKLPVNGTMFVQDKATQPFIENADTKCVTIGHNRKATDGAINISNAHPFVTAADENGDFIIGVHNGKFSDWKQKSEGYKYDVDSEWAFNHLLKKGMDAFKDFTGVYALIWYDTRTPNVINVARTKERTLYYQFLEASPATKDKEAVRAKTLVMASEHGMLGWLTARNMLPMESKVWIFEEGFHYTFDVDDVSKWGKVKLPAIPAPYKPPPTQMMPSTNSQYGLGDKERLLREVKRVLKGEDTKVPVTIGGKFVPQTIATAAEVAEAEKQSELGREYIFDGDFYDANLGEISGIIQYDFGHGQIDPIDAILRGIDSWTAQRIIEKKYLVVTAQVAGLMMDSRNNVTYIMHKAVCKPMPADVVAAGGKPN